MDEILFLVLVTYILFGVALYYYIAHDIKNNQDFIGWTSDFLYELEEEKNMFGVFYSIVLIFLMLPVLIFLFFMYLTKDLIKRRK